VRYLIVLTAACLLAVGAAFVACRPKPPMPTDVAPPVVGGPGTLAARVISWDVGFRPETEAEWTARVVFEVTDARADHIDILLFPELFAAGLTPYAGTERPCEFVTRRMRDAVLPQVRAAAGPDMLVALGSYAHQEPTWPHALNRAPLLLNGEWQFADKIHPTQGESVEDPPIKPGEVLPVFRYRDAHVAVLVCFSLEMPEVAAALKKEGVRIVLAPTATADEHGVARILRTASARAVELGAAVLVAPLVGRQGDWANVGSAALYLPAQKDIDHRPQESERRSAGIARDDFVIPWSALGALRTQPAGPPETRPFLADRPFRVERR
jgi:predicted amidohydrolase